MSRKNKLILNTASAFLLQFVTFICGFILPKQFLIYYGSDVNGLVSSITRFLSVISLLEFGVGAVVQSNLYGPLAQKDEDSISKIVSSSQKFYKKLAVIFLGYIGILVIVYPQMNHEFGTLFTASLLVIISISTFAQYYFGITYQVLLNADQKNYVQISMQIGAIIANTLFCVGLMKLGCSVHIVKLASSIVFVVRPMFQWLYVKKHYRINRHIRYDKEPIKQKWNGFAQHLASVVTGEIDVILLTFVSTYQNVSIYSVYFMIVNGITGIIMLSTSGLESYWGNVLAKKEMNLLTHSFDKVETVTHAIVTFLFAATAVLIAPFISVYVAGTQDAHAYYLPLFGMLLTFAYAARCIRVPYFMIITAAGHYRQTQNGSFITAAINVVVSVLLVNQYGLIGVAFGTFSAMFFHTVYLVWYLSRNILKRDLKKFAGHVLVDGIAISLIIYLTQWFRLEALNYYAWVMYAIQVSLVSLFVTGIIFVPIYFKRIRNTTDSSAQSNQ